MEGEASRVDGADTRIILSNRRHFMAHSVILKQRSTLFKEMLEKESEVRNADIHYQIVLQNYDKKTGKEINPVFRRIPLDSNGHPTRPVTVIREGHDARDNLRLYGYFDRIIATFFDEDLTLDTTDITTTLEDAAGLVNAAEYLGSVAQIRKFIDNSLLSMGQTLFQAIASNPIAWVDVGYRLESKVIFRDAMTHLVGRYRELTSKPSEIGSGIGLPLGESLLASLPNPVRELVEAKVLELQQTCQNVEQMLVTYYPAGLHRAAVSNRVARDDIGRASYATDIFVWMALALFRHYIGFAIASGQTYQARDGGYEFYKMIEAGGLEYLHRATLASFHNHFPMSTKGRAVFSNHLEAIKEAAKDYVKPLLLNRTGLETGRYPVAWLLCAGLRAEEIPWLEKKPSVAGGTFTSGQDIAYDDEYEDDLDEDAEEAYTHARHFDSNSHRNDLAQD